MTVKQLSATELKNRIQQEEKPFLLDVREPNEFEYAHIANSVLIPLNQLPNRLGELDPQQEIVVICHHGMRSLQAANYLVQSGYKNIANLTGGIDAWSCTCDSSVRRY
ncbi:MAG: rhodanese [Methylococcaceae bacterium]|nr:rhodanese [Methylococcaceae bacterium]